MRNFQEKSKWRTVMESRPALAVFGALVLFFAWNVLVFVSKMNDTIKNRKIAENKVAELSKEKVKLEADIGKLKTQSGVEETIRNKFGLAKEGEDVIVIVDDDAKRVSAGQEDSGGFFSFFKNWFK